MAGVLALLLPNPVAPLPPAAEENSQRWQIAYARFFTFPRLKSYSASLRPLPKHKALAGGTWISASTTASLQLLPNPLPTLLVYVSGKIIEEHFVSNLNFSWPQVSCGADWPTHGSTVVFASYRDSNSEIQKFAMKFSAAYDAQMFLDVLKDSSKDVIDVGLSKSDFASEILSQSEETISNGHHCRENEVSTLAITDGCYSPEMPFLNVNSEEPEVSLQQNNVTSLEAGISSSLPPSFTTLLSECAQESIQDLCSAGSHNIPLNKFVGISEQPHAPEETDLKAEIRKYLTDASFHDILAKVERVIDELGDDLLL